MIVFVESSVRHHLMALTSDTHLSRVAAPSWPFSR